MEEGNRGEQDYCLFYRGILAGFIVLCIILAIFLMGETIVIKVKK